MGWYVFSLIGALASWWLTRNPRVVWIVGGISILLLLVSGGFVAYFVYLSLFRGAPGPSVLFPVSFMFSLGLFIGVALKVKIRGWGKKQVLPNN